MSRLIKHVLIVFMISGMVWAQGSGFFRPFGEMDTKYEEPRIEEPDLKTLGEFTPVEKPVDPDFYILGPGDLLGVNIISDKSLTFTLQVNPTGDLLIPSVGILKVSGLTLSETINLIKDFVLEKAYRNSIVDVTLVGLRRFRVLVVGAVQKPGFVVVTPVDRLTDVIKEAEGLHKYADEENIQIIRKKSVGVENVSLREFLIDGDLNHNPTFQEEDRVEIPYLPVFKEKIDEFITYNESAVLVTGFLQRPGAFRYFPGYTVLDYVGMAGGILETGNTKKVRVIRSNKEMDVRFEDYVKPGDTIYVPENIRSHLFGNISMIQTASALVSVYLGYLAATRK